MRKSPMWAGLERRRQPEAARAEQPRRRCNLAYARVRIPLRRNDALTFTGYYPPRAPHGWVQNRVGILTAFIYAAIVAQGGYKMLFGSEHPGEAGRRRARAPKEARKRLPVLRLNRALARKLWHTGCVAALPSDALGGSAVWGHGGGSSQGNMQPMCPLLRRNVSAANLFVGPRR